MAALASDDDLEARWRTLTTDEATRALTLLDDASAYVRLRYPDIDDRMVGNDPLTQTAVSVVCSMVRRAMLAPSDGMQTDSETAGPFSYSRSFTNPQGNIYLTTAEAALLAEFANLPTAVSMRLS